MAVFLLAKFLAYKFRPMPATLSVMDLPTNEPTVIRAGDSISWSRELPEYSADDGWALKYKLLYAAGAAVSIASSGAGTTHTVDLTSAQTAAYIAGQATLVAYVENSTTAERVTLESTPITVLPDLTVAANYDGRSANRITLDNLRAALSTMVADGSIKVVTANMDGRSTTFRSTEELREMILHYEREVAKENALIASINGIASGRVQVRF